MIDLDFCISSYLVFRYVAKPEIGWTKDVLPDFPNVKEQGMLKVRTAAEVLERLEDIVEKTLDKQECGVLLSAGIDSAIIAAMLLPGTRAYTIRFVAENAIDEAPGATKVVEKLGLKHSVIDVTWDDYDEGMDLLMKRKKAPLHPVEVGLFKASSAACNDGIKLLFVGNGADSTFGGMDKLLSKDWTFDEFIRRYTFLEPSRAVKRPVSVADIYEPYKQNDGVNVVSFLKVVHGLGIIQMFENAIHAGGCSIVAPFEQLALDTPLNLQRIRNGEPKYILNEVFKMLYPDLDITSKIPFARPVTQWLKDWRGPIRAEFLDDLSMDEFTGEQKWQLYCLERFLNLLYKGEI